MESLCVRHLLCDHVEFDETGGRWFLHQRSSVYCYALNKTLKILILKISNTFRKHFMPENVFLEGLKSMTFNSLASEILFSLWPHPQHMEVPMAGIECKLQLQPMLQQRYIL